MSETNGRLFSRVAEKDVTRAIANAFYRQLDEYAECAVIVVGAGPAGLMAGRTLASEGFKTLIVEQNNYLGGGFWLGGYMMNKLTVRAPAQEVLEELGVPLEKVVDGHYVADGPHACSKLIAATCDSGVKFLNLTSLDDVVLRDDRVAGAVINWTPVQALPRQITCVDPVALESKVVIDATGHDAVVCRKLEKRGLLETCGEGGMWVDRAEDLIVERTGEAFPGLIVCGMAVSTLYGVPRMGPTFGGMLLSGRKAGEVAVEALRRAEEPVAAGV